LIRPSAQASNRSTAFSPGLVQIVGLCQKLCAHLDGEAEALVLATLKKAAEGRTVLMATHSPAARAVCARIVDLSGEEAGS